jgi:hypothetical protein
VFSLATHPARRTRASWPLAWRRISLIALATGVIQIGALSATEHAPPPVVTSFDINGGAASIQASAPAIELHHVVAGMRPSQYRVSRHADFSDAAWQPYVDVPVMRDWFSALRGPCGESRDSHTIVLFFQVRADLGVQVQVLDGQRAVVPQRVESNVVRDSICALSGG